MTFRPYTGKVRLGNSDIFLDISDFSQPEYDGYVLSRNGETIVATLIGQDKLNLGTPSKAADAATKAYVDGLIDSEVADRIAGDGYLQGQIDNIVSNLDPAALDSLTEIVSAFQGADGSLIDTVNNLAITASTALAAEAAERAVQDGYLSSDISDETSRAMAAEAVLLSAISSETSRATGAESVVQAAVNAEGTRAAAAESVLQGNIDSEASARAAADSSEEAARIAGDNSLQSAISAELLRATTAEQGLQSQISSIISNTDSASLDSLAEIVDAFQNADGDLLAAINSLSVSANSALQAEINRATAAEDSKLDLAGGTMSGSIGMGNNKITGLANGTSASDAVNLSQLQSAILDIDPAGLAGQIQFNGDGYDFDASANLAWDNSANSLFVGGTLSLGEVSSLPAEENGVGKLVAKDNNGLYFVDSAGVNHYVLADGLVELSGASVVLDANPELPGFRTITMTETTTFSTLHLGAGRSLSLRLVAGAATRGVFFPDGWKWLAGSVPASVPNGKVAMLSIVAYGENDTDVVAGWSYTDSTSISGSGTAGQVAFFNGPRSVSSESNLRWDSTTDKLIIGLVPSPSANLHVAGTAQIEGSVVMNGAVTIGDASGDTVTVNGSATFNSPMSMGSNKITDVADPSVAQDAVNLSFLESRRLLSIQSMSSSGDIDSDKDVVFITGLGGSTVRLPLATYSNNGKVIVIKKRNGGDEDMIGTVLGSGQSIDGSVADGTSDLQQLFLVNESVSLISDGNNWYII